MHGLGYTSASWDAELLGDDSGGSAAALPVVVPSSTTSSSASSFSSSSSSVVARGEGGASSPGVLGSLFGAVKLGAAVVDAGFDLRRNPFEGLRDLHQVRLVATHAAEQPAR